MAAPLTRRLTRQRNQGAIGRAGVPTTTQENDMATSNQGGDKNKQGSGQGANQGSNQGASQGSKQSDTSKRGFASMDPDQQREIASEGGRAAHEKGTAHEFTSEEARRAGSMSHKNDQGSSQSSGTALIAAAGAAAIKAVPGAIKIWAARTMTLNAAAAAAIPVARKPDAAQSMDSCC